MSSRLTTARWRPPSTQSLFGWRWSLQRRAVSRPTRRSGTPIPATAARLLRCWRASWQIRTVRGGGEHDDQGGDFGARIRRWLAVDYPGAVRVIYLNAANMHPASAG